MLVLLAGASFKAENRIHFSARCASVEVPVVRPGQHNHDAWPAVVMKALALTRGNADLQHSHRIVFKEDAMVRRRSDHRIQMRRPLHIVGLRHVILHDETHE